MIDGEELSALSGDALAMQAKRASLPRSVLVDEAQARIGAMISQIQTELDVKPPAPAVGMLVIGEAVAAPAPAPPAAAGSSARASGGRGAATRRSTR